MQPGMTFIVLWVCCGMYSCPMLALDGKITFGVIAALLLMLDYLPQPLSHFAQGSTTTIWCVADK